jgi:hypothetical protein
MVEPEENHGGMAVDRDDNAAPAVADVAMTRGQRALWIALIAAQVLIAAATVLCLIYVPGRSEANRNQEWATRRANAAEHRSQSSDLYRTAVTRSARGAVGDRRVELFVEAQIAV